MQRGFARESRLFERVQQLFPLTLLHVKFEVFRYCNLVVSESPECQPDSNLLRDLLMRHSGIVTFEGFFKDKFAVYQDPRIG
jgi:hypothetical protein